MLTSQEIETELKYLIERGLPSPIASIFHIILGSIAENTVRDLAHHCVEFAIKRLSSGDHHSKWTDK